MTEIEYYIDNANEHRWRVRSANGEIIGASSEGFHDKEEAKANLERLRSALNAVVKAELRDVGLRALDRKREEAKPVRFFCRACGHELTVQGNNYLLSREGPPTCAACHAEPPMVEVPDLQLAGIMWEGEDDGDHWDGNPMYPNSMVGESSPGGPMVIKGPTIHMMTVDLNKETNMYDWYVESDSGHVRRGSEDDLEYAQDVAYDAANDVLPLPPLGIDEDEED